MGCMPDRALTLPVPPPPPPQPQQPRPHCCPTFPPSWSTCGSSWSQAMRTCDLYRSKAWVSGACVRALMATGLTYFQSQLVGGEGRGR